MKNSTADSLSLRTIDRLVAIVTVAVPMLAFLMYLTTIKQVVADGTPLALDLNGNGRIDITGHTSSRQKVYTLFSLGRFVTFDLDADGEMEEIDWMKAGEDGLLLDLTKGMPSTRIDGSWLFANTVDGNYANGFEKLAKFDLNSDGVVSGKELDKIALWVDDGDAKFDTDELVTLASKGIREISTSFSEQKRAYGTPLMIGDAFLQSGEPVYLEDVWFMDKRQIPRIDRNIGSFLSFFARS